MEASSVRKDNLLSGFGNILSEEFGKHRSCYASYTKVKKLRKDCTTTYSVARICEGADGSIKLRALHPYVFLRNGYSLHKFRFSTKRFLNITFRFYTFIRAKQTLPRMLSSRPENFRAAYFWPSPSGWFSSKRIDSRKDSFIEISGF